MKIREEERRMIGGKRKKQQEKLRKMMQKVQSDLNAVSRQDPHSGYLLKKKMKSVKSMEKRFEREAEDMTAMPEEEGAIFFRMDAKAAVPAGKIVLEYDLDCLQAPVQSTFQKYPSGSRDRKKVCIVGEKMEGKKPHFCER